jgi:protoporphyrinogen oxidase
MGCQGRRVRAGFAYTPRHPEEPTNLVDAVSRATKLTEPRPAAGRARRGAPATARAACPAAAAPGPPLTILGGGPAGLAVAFYAAESGLPCELFERDANLGGMCRTYRFGEHLYDSGAHRFHDRDPEITADLRRLLGDELVKVCSPSQIYDRGRLVDFPPTPLNWLAGRGLGEAVAVGAELLKARWRPRPERSFEDVATNRYGRRLGEPLLMAYSEKLWGLPSGSLAPEVATRRLSGLGLRALLFELLLPRGRSAHLEGSFLYPRFGYGTVAARLSARLPAHRVHTAHEVAGLECEGRLIRAVRFTGRSPLAVGGRLASTLPLTVLVRALGGALPAEAGRAAARLRFRHIRLVFLRLARARHSANATIYIPDPRLAVSRVSEPKNRSEAMAPPHETGLLAEVPCSTGDELFQLSEAALGERVVAELASIGLLAPGAVLGRETRLLPNAYPVYALGYAEQVKVIGEALAEIDNLDVLGRGGMFWYSHLHDQLRLAKDYVRSLASLDGPPARLETRLEMETGTSISPHILRSARKL